MSDIVIRVEGLGKLYHIGEYLPYRTLTDAISGLFASSFKKFKNGFKPEDKTKDCIWAIKDLSFEVKRGEVVAVIGRNGAGKSTLLKILSRITAPTEGYAEVQGRVSSLLEVGIGFHPELTGRDNIYFNGALMGMKRHEIARRFDEIVSFSEIEKFIDTPVKYYSSGMYVRLAFAVAAHLEPDILLVDEVLAVGDVEFQKKCLGKMDDVAKGGRTVLFISHNMGRLVNLCPRAILLVQGKKWRDAESNKVINEYMAMGQVDQGEHIWPNSREAPGSAKVRFRALRIISDGQAAVNVDIQKDIQIELEYWNFQPGLRISANIQLLDQMGVCVFASANIPSANLIIDDWSGKDYPVGRYRSVCTIPGNFLNEGRYTINASIVSNIVKIEAAINELVYFTVYETGGMRKEFTGHWAGVVRPKFAWQTYQIQEGK